MVTSISNSIDSSVMRAYNVKMTVAEETVLRTHVFWENTDKLVVGSFLFIACVSSCNERCAINKSEATASL